MPCLFDSCPFDAVDHPKERYMEKIVFKFKEFINSMNYQFNTTFIEIPLENNNSSETQDNTNGFNPPVDQIQLALQRNECQFAWSPYKTPVLVENITQGPVFDHEITSLISVYKLDKKSNEADGDALDSLSSFSENTVFFIISLFLFIGLMIFLSQSFKSFSDALHVKWIPSLNKKRLKKTRRSKRILDIWFLMFSSLFKVFDPFPRLKTLSMFLLWICFTSFGFFVTYFYSSMIKTEAVTVKTPDVAMSYQDVLDMNLNIIMDGSFDAYLSFKNAGPKSLKGRIWKESPELINLQSDLFTLEKAITSTKTIFIGYSKPINVFKYIGYTKIKPRKNLRMMLTTDASEEAFLRVSAFNSFLDNKYKKMITRHSNHIFQANVFYLIIDLEVSRYLMFFYTYITTGLVNEDFADFDDYVSSKILLDQPHIFTPEVSYFYGLFCVVCVGFVLSFFSFVIEFGLKNMKNCIVLYFNGFL